MFPTKKRVLFRQGVPYPQKSETTVTTLLLAASLCTSGTYHILLPWGFSQIQGICCRCKDLTKSSVARKQALPVSTFLRSTSFMNLTPHGSSLVRITDVRSLAGEKVEHGGANMAANSRPRPASALMFWRTAGRVRSSCSPCKRSHDLAEKPAARAARATPLSPEKKSPR